MNFSTGRNLHPVFVEFPSRYLSRHGRLLSQDAPGASGVQPPFILFSEGDPERVAHAVGTYSIPKPGTTSGDIRLIPECGR